MQRVADALNAGQADALTLQRVVGKGAWGTVYQGAWRGMEVAVKTGACGCS